MTRISVMRFSNELIFSRTFTASKEELAQTEVQKIAEQKATVISTVFLIDSVELFLN